MKRPAYRIEYAPVTDALRVYFEVEDEPERVVKIRAVGLKDRNRVLISGEEIELR